MSNMRIVTAAALVLAVIACNGGATARDSDSSAAEPQATSSAATGTASVTGARIAEAHAGPAGEWQMPA